MSELPKTYDPKSVEDKLYSFWNDSGFFHAEVNPDKKPYTIVIPPPNVTGQLHMGHAFEDVYKRQAFDCEAQLLEVSLLLRIGQGQAEQAVHFIRFKG